MTTFEKMRRIEELFVYARDLIFRQVRQEQPRATDDQIKREVCLRMYGDDPRFRKLVQDHWHVSD